MATLLLKAIKPGRGTYLNLTGKTHTNLSQKDQGVFKHPKKLLRWDSNPRPSLINREADAPLQKRRGHDCGADNCCIYHLLLQEKKIEPTRALAMRTATPLTSHRPPAQFACPTLSARYAVLPRPRATCPPHASHPFTLLRCEKCSGGRAQNPGMDVAWILHDVPPLSACRGGGLPAGTQTRSTRHGTYRRAPQPRLLLS